MKTLETQLRNAHILRWAVTLFVSFLLIVGAGSFWIQSHFYSAALHDVQVLSKAALHELKTLTSETDEHRAQQLNAMVEDREAIRKQQFESVERKLDAIIDRVNMR